MTGTNKKILMVHNYYNTENPSGENISFDAECNFIKNNFDNITVVKYVKYNNNINKMSLLNLMFSGFSYIWNFFIQIEFSKFILHERPDIIHVHNVFPLISNSIFKIFNKNKSKVILTTHNLRLFCAAGIPVRKNKICIDCITQRSVLPALKFKCYKSSFIKTLPIALNIYIFKILKIKNNIDLFISLTKYQKKLLILGGIDPDKIVVKPNFYPSVPKVIPVTQRNFNFLYVGRLSVDKGILVLLDAWLHMADRAPKLIIIGSGELYDVLKIRSFNLNIELLGHLSHSETEKYIANSTCLVFPSLIFEGFPMAIREAFAFGTPIISSDIDPIIEITNGYSLLFKSGNYIDLANKVLLLNESFDEKINFSKRSSEAFLNCYGPNNHLNSLKKIYNLD